MVCLEVSVNGRRVCRAGVGARGFLHANLAFRTGGKDSELKGRTRRRLDVSVGGMVYGAKNVHQSLGWPRQLLKIDDDVRVRVVRAAEADPPSERTEVGPLSPKFEALVWALRQMVRTAGKLSDPRAKRLEADLRALLKKHGPYNR
jgi:hypothetical protein